jgi:hypothetical protein
MPGVVLAPTRSRPASPLETAPTASRARETVESTLPASCARTWPAAVRYTRRPIRSKSDAPSSFSRAAIC